MFAYIETDSFLHRRNPVVKLIVIALMTVVLCLSYFPVFPGLTFVLVFLGLWLAGRIPLPRLCRQMVVFFFICFFFVSSMLILRGLHAEDDILLRLGILRWSRKDLIHTITLGLRMLSLVTLSMGFVLTTHPGDLVLSFIHQCKLSPVHGYATMATYRFLPELQSQVELIHLAQEIRGIPWNRGIFSRFTSPFRVILPLLCLAARRGERLACAMESRGLGRSTARTYYKKMRVTQSDRLFLLISCLLYVALALICAKFHLFHFNPASIK